MKNIKLNPWIGLLAIGIIIALNAKLDSVANKVQTDAIVDIIRQVDRLEIEVASLKEQVEPIAE